MLKKYRRNFVILNVGAVGIALLFVFILIGMNYYSAEYSELKSVMAMVLKPYNLQIEDDSDQDNRTDREQSKLNSEKNDRPSLNEKEGQSEEKPDAAAEENRDQERPKPSQGGNPPEPKGNGGRTQRQADNITTVFYNKKTETASVLSETLSFYGDVDEIAKAVVASKDSFGVLKEYNVIYYKEKTENNYKIALTDVSYIISKLIPVIILLVFGYMLSLLLVMLLSLKLSYVAAAPMEKAIDMERRFVADISHDLKTPITVILANNSIIKSDPDASVSEQRQWIDSTDAAAKDMMELINEMLTLSSLDETDKSVVREKVNLSAVLKKAVLQMESVAYERGIVMKDDIQEELFILSSEEYARRICSGLIDNAIKYEPDGGSIDISAYSRKKNIVFRVKNEGSIIDETDLPHIFDRFYRGDKTRGDKKGHGLGLPVIKKMTELTGAQISAESSKEKGTEFVVTFESAV